MGHLSDDSINSDVIYHLEEIVNDFKDVFRLQTEALTKRDWFLFLLLVFSTALFIKQRTYSLWVDIAVSVLVLILIRYYPLAKRLNLSLGSKGEIKRLLRFANEITFLRDKTFYESLIAQGCTSATLIQLEKYVKLKIADEKRRWAVPNLVGLSIIGVVGLSIFSKYIDTLKRDELNSLFALYFFLAILIISLEIIGSGLVRILGKKDRYDEILAAIIAAKIRFDIKS